MGRQDLRAADLARTLGVSHLWVSRRMRGVVPMTLDDVATLAGALGVPVEQLISRPAPVRS